MLWLRAVWCKGSLFVSLVVVILALGMDNMAYGQYIRSCGTRSPLTPPQIAAGSLAGGSLNVIPSLCVSERYDSNVFYAPATPGLTRNDFVTNVNPMLLINHNSEYASGVLNVGGFGEVYVNNPDLNYLGTKNDLLLNLDNSIKRLFPKASLRLTNDMRYAPTPPGFSSLAAGTSPGAPVNTPNVFAQGIVVQRVNAFVDTGALSASYATTASTTVDASYSFGILRFGSSPTPGPTTLFDTTTHTGTVGGTVQVSSRDILSPKYSYMHAGFSNSSSSDSVQVNTATLKWTRTLTPNLVAELGGGGLVIDPGLTTFAANAALILSSQNNSATISYQRTAVPSFQLAGVVLVSDIFSLSAVQNLSQQWQLVENANYAEGFGSNGIKYHTYVASMDLNYWVTRIWSMALSYDYMKSDFESSTTDRVWARNAVTLSLRASLE